MNIKSQLIILIIILIISNPAFSKDKNWKKFGSSWVVANSLATTASGRVNPWNYYEFTNFNSLQSLKPFSTYTSLEIDSMLFERVDSPVEFIIPFSITDEGKGWLYKFYAFRFSGNYWGINQVSLIYSDRIDKTKPLATKNNTFIKEIESSKCKIKYGIMNNYNIVFKENKVVLYINNKETMSVSLNEKQDGGYLAFSIKNARISIDKIVLKNDNKTIFQDLFDEDSIQIKKLQVTREPAPKEDDAKKPE